MRSKKFIFNKAKKVYNRVINIFRSEQPIPDYNSKREIIDGLREKYQVRIFVETGTFLGDTVEFFKNKFDKLYSIELSEELANKAKLRFRNDSNVQIIHGDSGEVLDDLMNKIEAPALFWLDGHYSSEFFMGNEYIKTARGTKDTPVEKELDTLLSNNIRKVILVDDARLFKGIDDYPSIRRLRKKVTQKKGNYTFLIQNDIIQILPKK